MGKTVPPEDEFDVMLREGWAFPGVFVFWVALVRGYRAIAARFASATRDGPGS